mgnify:CR=1 FL=1
MVFLQCKPQVYTILPRFGLLPAQVLLSWTYKKEKGVHKNGEKENRRNYFGVQKSKRSDSATVGGNNLVESKKNGLVCDINENSLAESVIDLSNNNDLYSDMINHLKNTDYSNEFEKYKEQWKNLLEG